MVCLYPRKTTPGVSDATDFEAFAYDAAGHVLTWRRRDGALITTFYDDLGRLVIEDAEITISMDGRGRYMDNIFIERLALAHILFSPPLRPWRLARRDHFLTAARLC